MNPQAVQMAIEASGVATLTLNRPEVHNAFDDHLIAGLTHKLRELDHNAGRARGRPGGQRQELLGRRRPQLDEAHGPLLRSENLRDAVALASLMRTLER